MTIKKYILLVFKSCILYLSCFSQAAKDTSVNFYFAINSAQLDSNQHKILNDFTSAFRIKAIKGYADTTGAKKYNFSLSQKRAFSVYTALNKSVDSTNNIDLFYLGENAEEPKLWKNRRVQVIATQVARKEVTHKIPVNESASDTTAHIPTVVRDFNLEYVYFMPDQAVIIQESLSYIQELADILKTYKTETFEIIGHINYQSRFDSTHLTDIYELSKRRAKALYDYLVEQGIPASRMTYRGIGNSHPIYPKPKNDEQRRKNMRVQIIIKK